MTGFIGLGNMAQAIIGGILSNGVASERDIVGYDPSVSARNRTAEKYNIAMADSNQSVVRQADILVFAVKPQILESVITETAPYVSEETLIISIAPGKTIAWITELFGKAVKVIRCMPNTPALVGAGMTGYCVSKEVTEEEKKKAIDILESFGKAEEIPEHLMAAVTSVSGSAPAYVFILIEAMADQAVADGMSRTQAYEFAAQAVMGSAKMMLDTGRHPAELKDMVCSPAGTTIEAVKVLERAGFRAAIQDAMEACTIKAEGI